MGWCCRRGMVGHLLGAGSRSPGPDGAVASEQDGSIRGSRHRRTAAQGEICPEGAVGRSQLELATAAHEQGRTIARPAQEPATRDPCWSGSNCAVRQPLGERATRQQSDSHPIRTQDWRGRDSRRAVRTRQPRMPPPSDDPVRGSIPEEQAATAWSPTKEPLSGRKVPTPVL